MWEVLLCVVLWAEVLSPSRAYATVSRYRFVHWLSDFWAVNLINFIDGQTVSTKTVVISSTGNCVHDQVDEHHHFGLCHDTWTESESPLKSHVWPYNQPSTALKYLPRNGSKNIKISEIDRLWIPINPPILMGYIPWKSSESCDVSPRVPLVPALHGLRCNDFHSAAQLLGSEVRWM